MNAIIEEIKNSEQGCITFKRFMELALYHPECGYYSKATIGKKGDFFTSVSVGPIFARTIARAIDEMLSFINANTVLELGANDGTFAYDFLNYMREIGKKPSYIIIEKAPNQIKIIEERLKDFSNQIYIVEDMDELNDIEGVVFSNEFFDALPVNVVTKKKGKLMEVFVSYDEEKGFFEVLGPVSDKRILDYLEFLDIDISDDFRTEINLEAVDIISKLAKILKQGFVLTIDYGFSQKELYSDYRREGTIACYRKHKVSFNPYEHVGEQDITSHVNFTAIKRYGEINGLITVGFTNQANFLINSGILDEIRNEREILQAKTLIMPDSGMGEVFKVLVQYKGNKKIENINLKSLKNIPKRSEFEL